MKREHTEHLKERFWKRVGKPLSNKEIGAFIYGIKSGWYDEVRTSHTGRKAYRVRISGKFYLLIYQPDINMIITVLKTNGKRKKIISDLNLIFGFDNT